MDDLAKYNSFTLKLPGKSTDFVERDIIYRSIAIVICRERLNMNNVMITSREMIERIDSGRCPFCNKDVFADSNEFRDLLSLKEFRISGLCQKCQDDFFTEE